MNESSAEHWTLEGEDRRLEIPRRLRKTYRFADGVMVWAYDLVVWIYPDGKKVKSEVKGDA
jgi:hypothetical protein